MVFLDILQDGDFRVFVRDMQANVACTEVVLMQA
jgi:TPP-dependent 2-oxoacid decarboxylase